MERANNFERLFGLLMFLQESRTLDGKVGVGALATKDNIARRISNFRISCDICGNLEDSDTQVLFDYPLAVEIWRESKFEDKLWRSCPLNAVDRLMMAAQSLDNQRLGEFVAVMWEVWNERNRVVFSQGVVGGRSGLHSEQFSS